MLPSTILALIFISVNDSFIKSIDQDSHNWNHIVSKIIHLVTTEILQSISVAGKRIYLLT